MAMIVAKVGSRKAAIRINISEKTSMVGFSAGFLRLNSLTPNNCRYVRFGYDPDIRCIGVEFLAEDNKLGECLKLSWPKAGTTASCPIRSLLGHARLTLKDVAGGYENERLQGPMKIVGFCSKGFLLGPI
ncbi:MAG: hypothetical protein KKE53_11485 [Proteobacteria bacterium]|nr:hypothetical protein [Pseudomonadota bacterium]